MSLGGLVGCGEFSCEDFLIAFRAEGMFSLKIPVNGADGEGRGDGDVGKAETGENSPYQLAAGLGAGDPFVHVEMENRSSGIAPLQLFRWTRASKGSSVSPTGSWVELV